MRSLKLLLISTPIGSLGSGQGGGVELTIKNLSQVLTEKGHQACVVAPSGSVLPDSSLVTIAGAAQVPAQTQNRAAEIRLPARSVLSGMWEYARENQNNYDLIINFAYDWLPLYLTPFFSTPVVHFISMGSCSAAMDDIVQQVARRDSHRLGFYTQSQAETFQLSRPVHCLGNAIDLSLYHFCDRPESFLTFVGRIAPEKGLEDAVALAQTTRTPLKILGKMENEAYWQQICETYPDAPVEYLGFCSTDEMQQVLRKSKALVMPHRWVEAFGTVAIEALACGTPVIAYQRGGPAEIVRDGKTGWLVSPGSMAGLREAVGKIDKINRHDCRQQAEEDYGLSAWGDRFCNWFAQILHSNNEAK